MLLDKYWVVIGSVKSSVCKLSDILSLITEDLVIMFALVGKICENTEEVVTITIVGCVIKVSSVEFECNLVFIPEVGKLTALSDKFKR